MKHKDNNKALPWAKEADAVKSTKHSVKPGHREGCLANKQEDTRIWG